MKQAGSLVNDDRLRFDFSHYAAVTADELRRIEEIANGVTLRNSGVSSEEMSKDAAMERGRSHSSATSTGIGFGCSRPVRR